MFQQIGGKAYKPGLETTHKLDEHLGHPHQEFRTIHIAGTNGKGSCSHTIAAVLQAAGYKVGLFTSPHLIDFRERIRINGEMIPEEYVVNFVEVWLKLFSIVNHHFLFCLLNHCQAIWAALFLFQMAAGYQAGCCAAPCPTLSFQFSFQFSFQICLLCRFSPGTGAGRRYRCGGHVCQSPAGGRQRRSAAPPPQRKGLRC